MWDNIELLQSKMSTLGFWKYFVAKKSAENFMAGVRENMLVERADWKGKNGKRVKWKTQFAQKGELVKQ